MKASVCKIGTPRRLLVHRGNERRLVTQHPRRRILSLAAGAAVLPAMSRVAWAQPYPTRSVRIVVGFAAGGINDVFTRLIAQWLSERMGQQFVIENRIGAGSNLSIETVAKSRPDGYTLVMISSTNARNVTLYKNLNFDFIRDIAPVASLYRNAPFVVVVNPSFPAKTIPEFIGYARANPGKINMAHSGVGSGPHVAGELFKMMAGVDLVGVPYRGGSEVMTSLLGGQVQVSFDPLGNSIEHVRAGRLRALAVTTAMRSPELPEVPAVGEFVPGYEASGWQGIGAPRDTPTEIIDILNKEINAGLGDTRMKARFTDLGGYTPFASAPAELRKFIADDVEKWGKVIRAAGIKAE
jgi:tripartite-type tricarboxylate transporter receptor subunit TctC